MRVPGPWRPRTSCTSRARARKSFLPFLTCLKDQDENVRMSAIYSMSSFPDRIEKHHGVFLKLLADREAGESLRRMGGLSSGPARARDRSGGEGPRGGPRSREGQTHGRILPVRAKAFHATQEIMSTPASRPGGPMPRRDASRSPSPEPRTPEGAVFLTEPRDLGNSSRTGMMDLGETAGVTRGSASGAESVPPTRPHAEDQVAPHVE